MAAYPIPETIKYLVENRNKEHISVCTVEEMSELTKVLTKYFRNDSKFTKESLAEEIAHVLLMVTATQLAFEIPDYELHWHMQDALLRAMQKIQTEKLEGENQNGSGQMD